MWETNRPWRATEPVEWPRPPQHFSFSVLTDIEACPRRWSLRNALYGTPDKSQPYPRRVQGAALAGTVVHATLDDLVASIGAAGSMTPADVVDVLRSKGGISSAIEDQVNAAMLHLETNPRMRPRMAEFERLLKRQVPEMRQLVQSALARVMRAGPIRLPGSGSLPDSGWGPLGPGFHPEVKLAPAGLPWIGWADAIRLGHDVCEIIDYKSGTLSTAHHEQLRIYALLWARDQRLNPTGRLADSLTVIYPGKIETWLGPTEEELLDLERSLLERATRAAGRITQSPPPATVSAEVCRYCDVKQMCGPYWLPSGQDALHEPTVPIVRSVQAVVTGRRTNRAWDVVIEADTQIAVGQAAVLVSERDADITPGDRLRLIDARVSGDDDQPRIVTLGSWSEAFVIP